ncbi:hypothetical protein HAX54_050792 [Datura stramonium]|uniref:Uncharacterized protein n=1 Tax=Datura stramonium TaxID=4076 RepID=A0ABS8SWW2_DATST|nr:hypothetical protein [Datura stramonium]
MRVLKDADMLMETSHIHNVLPYHTRHVFADLYGSIGREVVEEASVGFRQRRRKKRRGWRGRRLGVVVCDGGVVGRKGEEVFLPTVAVFGGENGEEKVREMMGLRREEESVKERVAAVCGAVDYLPEKME